ncbi:uncharacterized protein K452DRAFT_333004 [Aplosporella prunicola CBS 121167]|uniref:Meiotic nuclear division protein 1 n=1 Tax=Aplosporella prunicola CBS 121167 TaxID=1176127 RepID=A0A6A6BG13_9PEZI|nr:uncharacterized protein K452DRAFT_333004 [Aplosporella prunicola CBS 121167]KAF2142194.1 hypothetical protein K452DRAFT_333004 [Aplosporella prunicola CBS 121167]
MAPKTLPPAAKQALILTWFQQSGVAHSIKDLEKALPSVASINGMQVKDYLQALSDDNKIRVEKIGSGNWYWSFPSEAKKAKEDLIAKSTEERDKANDTVAELKAKVGEANAVREDEEDMLMGGGEDRETLTTRLAALEGELKTLKKELAGYSDNDPVEVEKRRAEAEAYRKAAEAWTEQIQSMEMWFKEQTAGDREAMVQLKMTYYGDEYDEEEEGLKEL